VSEKAWQRNLAALENKQRAGKAWLTTMVVECWRGHQYAWRHVTRGRVALDAAAGGTSTSMRMLA